MYIKNVLFTFIIVAGFFGASELILASIGVSPALLTEDPFVGFAENVPQFVEATGADGSVILKTANNKRGLFNYQEFPKEKNGNTYRIFCMGGSTTYGRPYGDKVSFCGWLREYLNAADATRNWDVINAGGISFASYRVARLMNELKHYQPDLFIVYSGQNEFLEERSYGMLARLPPWLINLNSTLSGTRIYTVMKDMIDAVQSASLKQAQARNRLDGEVNEILNHTIGPQSYHRDDDLKRQVTTHYRLNLIRMIKIARSAGAGMILVQPAVNLKDMSPFKSEHREDLGEQAQRDWDVFFQRATDQYEAGNFSEALNAYRQALEIDDRYADLHYRIGKSHFELQQYDKAEQSFRRAVEEDIAPLRILASMQQIVAEVAASENVPLIDFPDIIRKAYLTNHDHAIFGKEYFPDHVHTNMEGYRLLGLSLFDELVDRGVATHDDTWNVARIEAISKEVIARIDPQAEGHTMLNLGKVLDWAGKFDEAYDSFKRALDILGPNPVIYDRLARTSYVLGKYDEAAHCLNEILVLAPEFPGVHSRLALIYEKQGRTDDAIMQCRAELERDPDNYYVHGGLAKLLEKKGDNDAALQHYNNALQFKPDYQHAHIELAYLLVNLHRYDDALEHAEAALRINPQQHRAHNVLGLIKKNHGKPEQAIQHFIEALRLQPDYTIAKENLQQVQIVHSRKDVDDDRL
ncbi:MAG: tetratricopeptide repeat protein [Pseudomonadota bacterium]